MQLAARAVGLLKSMRRKKKRRSSSTAASKPLQVTHPLQLYEDLYLTEQPYGLVCGVEIDLPAND